MEFEGRFFDGESGLRLDVSARIDPESQSLKLSHPDLPQDAQNWSLSHLRALRDEAREDQVTLALVTDEAIDSGLIDTARLTVRDPAVLAALPRLCPDLHKRDIAKGTAWKVVSRLGMAVGAVVLMIFVIIPALAGTMANLIPPEREARWGKSVVGQMERLFGGKSLGDLTCTNADGLAAFDRMVTRLTDTTDIDYDLNIKVFDHEMVNAFAAPGGQIVFMRGLIEEAESPEEVAAVLGHEIAHVENRDATRNTLRAAGSAGLLAMVLGDFAGGTIAVVMAETVLSASYTREAEALADIYALDMLNAAGVSTEGMADFFDSLQGEDGAFKIPEYLASHPATAKRANAAREFSQTQGETSPILSDEDWAALQNVCD